MRELMAMVALAIAATTVVPAFADEDLSQYTGWADAPQEDSSFAQYRTTKQSAAALTVRTANLSVTPGFTLNARNGLPPTRFDSFVASSGYDDKIYGVYGDSGAYTSWKTIDEGIDESGTATVYGLSTGHRSELPTLQSDPGVIVKPDSYYTSSLDRAHAGGGGHK